MKRLLIITRTSHPRGGADHIVATLCHDLPRYGWHVLPGLVCGRRFNLPSAYLDAHPGLQPVIIDGSLGTRLARLRSLESVIRQHNPEAVLVMRVFDAYEAVANIKRKHPRHAPRLIVGVRAFEPGYLGDMMRYRNVVDGCITSGQLIARALTGPCGLDPERVFSIPGGIVPPANPRPRSTLHDPLRLLYAGRLDQPQKRVGDILPLVRILSASPLRFHLDLVGDGPERSRLARELAPWIERGEVTLHGWLDHHALYRDIYPRADLFIHFAAYEGVTIAPREAMAHGVVPIVASFPGLAIEGQFIDQQNALVFPIGDVHAAARQILSLSRQASEFLRLSQAAARSQSGDRSHQGALESWDRALSKFLELPPRFGSIPALPGRTTGRLGSLRLPEPLEHRIRAAFGRPVLHQDPGSEWPTHSGLTTREEAETLAGYARDIDHPPQTAYER